MSLYVSLCIEKGGKQKVFVADITHNLSPMAEAAGIYKAMWHPEKIGAKYAGEIITVLSDGLQCMEDTPEWFKEFDTLNGWGDYEGLVGLVRRYLNACIEYPNAEICIRRTHDKRQK